MSRRACPHCGYPTRPMANFYNNVEVVETERGGISTRSEDRVEYLCGWCGQRLFPSRVLLVDDVAEL